MTRARAQQILATGNFDGCDMRDLELVATLTGSKKAVAEVRRRLSRLGSLLRDEQGRLRPT